MPGLRFFFTVVKDKGQQTDPQSLYNSTTECLNSAPQDHLTPRCILRNSGTNSGTNDVYTQTQEVESSKQGDTQDLSLTRVIHSANDAFEVKYEELEEILGKGYFATVFAGYRREDKLPVAIKHIRKNTPILMHRGPLEVQLLRRVAGEPGQSAAVALLDWYCLEEEVLLVQERPVPSIDLLKYISDHEGELPELEAKVLMRQLVEAVIEIHSRGVAHRDIKPENILVETGADVPRLRLIDFGCGGKLDWEICSELSGTPEYNSPELYYNILFDPVALTVWQLGVTLFAMLHGRVPFSHYAQILNAPPDIKDDLSHNCKDMLQSCLSKEPAFRPSLESLLLHPWLQL